MLNFGANLTELNLELGSEWHRRPVISTKLSIPSRAKDYVVGAPTEAVLNKVSGHPYLLDALVLYLRQLERLRWVSLISSSCFCRCGVFLANQI